MKNKVILLNKPVGITPLQCIQLYKQSHNKYTHVKLGYAGRLDPMAEGLLVVLVGDENKQKKQYEDLPKTYEFSALFGFTTDSYDVLGLPVLHETSPWTQKDTVSTKTFLNSLIGSHTQPYPPFSSKTVHGKPLFKWAREGKLSEIALPSRSISIYNISFYGIETIQASELLITIKPRIRSLQGVFRQKEILYAWEKLLTPLDNQSFTVCNAAVSCSSGTYIRSIVNNLGIFSKKGAIALRIKRTRIGEYSLSDSLKK